ncbi:MAG: methylated-DNA--[protein]-cysteine S-methyltransferase [Oscillibacter sp.]|nr:methylated-DNA--[protein]-cysteine S-methyltransferase [Oscillibacter sp.]
MAAIYQMHISSPVGPLTLTASEDALTGIAFGGAGDGGDAPSSALLTQTARELEEYFAGKRRTFTVPLAPAGTDFQRKVWAALRDIPYGETVSYGDLARRIGKPGAAIAVGQANSRNPIPIIVPCHRVIGADGKLVGYAGGLEIKKTLLRLEKVLVP